MIEIILAAIFSFGMSLWQHWSVFQYVLITLLFAITIRPLK